MAVVVLTTACGGDSPTPPVDPGGSTACATSDGSVTPIVLAPGGVRVLCSPRSFAGVQLPSAAGGSEYLIVAANANTILDVVADYRVTSTTGGGMSMSAASAAATNSAGSSEQRLTSGTAVRRPHHEVEDKLRNWTYTNLRPSAGRGIARGRAEQRAARGASAVRSSVAAAVPVVGQQLQFRVPDADSPCTKYDSLTAVVRAVSNRAVIVQDVAAPAGGFSDVDFAGIAAEFDSITYATDVSYFGEPTDDDANGRIVILFTPAINRLTPKGSTTGFTAGFFFAGDLFPRRGSGNSGCLQSNESELFYLLVPDPAGEVSITHSVRSVRELSRGTVAHEFEHMINAGRRLTTNASAFETPWLDEGLAHFAEEAVGRAVRGFGDSQRLSYADVFDTNNGGRDFDAFFEQNLARFRFWLARPDTSAGPSARTAENLSGRGAAWALVRHTADHFSSGNVRAFTRALVTGPEIGITNLRLRANAPYDSVFATFMVANYTSGLNIPGLPPKYDYASWNMRSAVAGVSGGRYPLLVNELGANSTYTTKARSSSGNYFRVSGSSAATVRFLSPTTNSAASFPGAREYVVRIR